MSEELIFDKTGGGAASDVGEGDKTQTATHNFYTGAGYQQAAMRTAKLKDFYFNLKHAQMGLSSESGEFADAIKKHLIYNKPLDIPNLIEEIGDILWFCALACETLGITLDEAMWLNIDKLRQRYPDAYTDADAQARADKA